MERSISLQDVREQMNNWLHKQFLASWGGQWTAGTALDMVERSGYKETFLHLGGTSELLKDDIDTFLREIQPLNK